MAITRVQGNARGTASFTDTINVTLSQAPANGNLLIAVIGGISSDKIVSSISETGVTWTKQVSNLYASYYDVEIWAGVVGSDASANITVSCSGSENYWVADVCEYSGLLTSGFLDKTATNQGFSASPNTGTTATTTQNDELWIGGIINYGDSGQSSPTNGFTLMDGALFGQMELGYLEKIVSAIGEATTGVTIVIQSWAGCIATFKAAAAAGGMQLFTLINQEDY